MVNKTILSLEQRQYFAASANVEPGTLSKFDGKAMYVGVKYHPEIKQNRNMMITTYPTEVTSDDVVSYSYYKRNVFSYVNNEKVLVHKKGDIKPKRTVKYEILPNFPNILHAWRIANEYPQVSYGLTNFRREVLIIDSDQVFKTWGFAIEKVTSFVEKTGLPFPNYVLQNPRSKHIQLGWVLDTPYTCKWHKDTSYEFSVFQDLTKSLAKLWRQFTGCDGDICFNGPSCKNPFYKDVIAEIFNWLSYSRRNIEETINRNIRYSVSSLPSSSYPSPYIDSAHLNIAPLRRIRKEEKQIVKKNRPPETSSRRTYEQNHFRTTVFQYMNKHKGNIDKAYLRKQLDVIAQEASTVTKKPLHSKEDLDGIFGATIGWCKKKWTGLSDKGDKDRERALFIKRVIKFNKAMEVRTYYKDMSLREASEASGISMSQIRNYRKLTKEELYDLSRDAIRLRDYCLKQATLDSKYYDYKESTIEALKLYEENMAQI